MRKLGTYSSGTTWPTRVWILTRISSSCIQNMVTHVWDFRLLAPLLWECHSCRKQRHRKLKVTWLFSRDRGDICSHARSPGQRCHLCYPGKMATLSNCCASSGDCRTTQHKSTLQSDLSDLTIPTLKIDWWSISFLFLFNKLLLLVLKTADSFFAVGISLKSRLDTFEPGSLLSLCKWKAKCTQRWIFHWHSVLF